MPAPAAPPPTVALTFDDGPDPRWTPAVLDALERAEARATFFVLTTQVQAHLGWVERIRAAGHAIGLHAHEHRRHTTIDAQELAADTDTALNVLARHDVTPTVWRLPWGVAGPHTAAIAAERGLDVVHWTADTEDWRGDPAPAMLARVLPELRAGAIVLAHDGLGPGATRAGCEQTVALIEPLVAAAHERGLRCDTLPEAVLR